MISQPNDKTSRQAAARSAEEARERQAAKKPAPKNSAFARDVLAGLTAPQRRLPSKYFYDKRGDAIFQAIMKMPEYYLTRSEYEILDMHKEKLQELFLNGSGRFNLIEFGAGDGFKTKILLKHFTEAGVDFKYLPIDISENVLQILTSDLKKSIPGLQVEGISNDYFKALGQLRQTADRRNVVLFLGSNIGNFAEKEALDFLGQLADGLNPHDLILIGFDLKKDPDQILAAYNDEAGITRAFNLNLLRRINEELGGNFNLQQWKHYPLYEPGSGEARSYLMSCVEQEVHISSLEKTFSFKAWEPVHVEISRKYDLDTISRYAKSSGFRVKENFLDCRHYFADSLWEKI
ncbi:putative methyltransferase [Flammeovirgaceae bacterium 311]|nr:putative methyltransferase [Flammeovirgaceae bacterium 311]